MPIQFTCPKCSREVTAPDAAAGKMGKCPFCSERVAIPKPAEADDEELIPLAPIDEEEEQRRRQEIHRLYEQESELLSETGPREAPATGPAPEEAEPADLHHFVVNYCLDLADGKLDRAESHVEKLRRYGFTGSQAVMDFVEGDATEPALDHIPRPVLQEFLRGLHEKVK